MSAVILKPVNKIAFIVGILILLNIGLILVVGDSEVYQVVRSTELQETLDSAAESQSLLTKAAGTGYDGTRSTPIENLEAAGWSDDIGPYLLVSLAGLTAGKVLSVENILLITTHIFFTISILLSSAIISLLFKRSVFIGFLYVSLASFAAFAVFGSPVGITHGRDDRYLGGKLCALLADCQKVDLFYGLQSAIIYVCFCGLLLIGLKVGNNSIRRTIIPASFVMTLGALFRADSLYGFVVLLFFSIFVFRKASLVRAIVITVATAFISITLKFGLVTLLYFIRFLQTGIGVFDHPQSHPIWHALYLGLSFNFSGVGTASSFGIIFQDNFLYQKILSTYPGVVLNSDDYAEIARSMFLSEVTQRPMLFVSQILSKLAVIFAANWVQIVWLVLALVSLQLHNKTHLALVLLIRPVNGFLLLLAVAVSSAGAVLVWPALIYLAGTIALLELFALIAMFSLFEVLSHVFARSIRH
jgi:hypothetical protein